MPWKAFACGVCTLVVAGIVLLAWLAPPARPPVDLTQAVQEQIEAAKADIVKALEGIACHCQPGCCTAEGCATKDASCCGQCACKTKTETKVVTRPCKCCGCCAPCPCKP